MSSPLDRIEAWAKFALKNGGPEDKFDDVLALVNVAKAAEAFVREMDEMGVGDYDDLREALAGLHTPADSQEPRDESGYPGLQGLEALADRQPEEPS